MAHRDIAGLASLFGKLQRPVVSVVPVVLDSEPGDGTHAGTSVNERAEDGLVAQPEDTGGFDGGEQLAPDEPFEEAVANERMSVESGPWCSC